MVSRGKCGSSIDALKVASLFCLTWADHALAQPASHDDGFSRFAADALTWLHATPEVMWIGGLTVSVLVVWGLIARAKRKRELEVQRKREALTRRFHSR